MNDRGGNSAVEDERRTALVTGASSGIGEEFARQLGGGGYDLVLTARRADRLAKLAVELESRHGITARTIAADLADPDSVARIVDSLHQAGIGIDYLVNNAGYGVPGRLTKPDWQTHEDFIRVLITAPVEFAYRLLPGMQDRGWGRIVNVASVAGLIPGSDGHTLYGAAKAMLIRFSESLAMENRSTGVRVVALCPGFTRSEFHDVTGTREIVAALPDKMWLMPREVVSHALRAIEQPGPAPVAVPGRYYRAMVLAARCLPQGWVRRYLERRASDYQDVAD